MVSLLAAVVWLIHGGALLWYWGKFRPLIAVVHGTAMALAGGLVIWLHPPAWLLYGLAAALGLIGGLGHPLAPGLWVGIPLVYVVHPMLRDGLLLATVSGLALTAEGALLGVALARRAGVLPRRHAV